MPKPFTGAHFILDPEKDTIYSTGWKLTGYTFTKKEDGWLCTLKVENPQGKRMVTFIHSHSIASIYEIWYSAMHTNNIKLRWLADRYGQ